MGMRVEESKYSIAEIIDWLKKRELVINNDYQRGGALWPTPAKSYFIDTILKDFPFPKVYFHEHIDRETKRPRREIVDGQQRLTTLVNFVSNKFPLRKLQRMASLNHKFFKDLTKQQQGKILDTPIRSIVIDAGANTELSI